MAIESPRNHARVKINAAGGSPRHLFPASPWDSAANHDGAARNERLRGEHLRDILRFAMFMAGDRI